MTCAASGSIRATRAHQRDTPRGQGAIIVETHGPARRSTTLTAKYWSDRKTISSMEFTDDGSPSAQSASQLQSGLAARRSVSAARHQPPERLNHPWGRDVEPLNRAQDRTPGDGVCHTLRSRCAPERVHLAPGEAAWFPGSSARGDTLCQFICHAAGNTRDNGQAADIGPPVCRGAKSTWSHRIQRTSS